MKIFFHRNFEKQYKKLRKSEKERLREKIGVFTTDRFDPILNNHPLRGRYKGYRSINVAGDLRLIYKELKLDTFLFVTIDTHSKLYGE